MRYFLALLFLLCSLPLLLPGGLLADTPPFSPNIFPTLEVARTSTPPTIDGVLDDPCWQAANVATNFSEFTPGDRAKPPVNTEAMVAYDDHHLYVAFRCYDDPATIRATFANRDQAFNDDQVGLILDTDLVRRRAVRVALALDQFGHPLRRRRHRGLRLFELRQVRPRIARRERGKRRQAPEALALHALVAGKRDEFGIDLARRFGLLRLPDLPAASQADHNQRAVERRAQPLLAIGLGGPRSGQGAGLAVVTAARGAQQHRKWQREQDDQQRGVEQHHAFARHGARPRLQDDLHQHIGGKDGRQHRRNPGPQARRARRGARSGRGGRIGGALLH